VSLCVWNIIAFVAPALVGREKMQLIFSLIQNFKAKWQGCFAVAEFAMTVTN
jgi:hypothetical protein